MRILHVAFGLGMGGIETMLVNIANAQAAADGTEVHVLIVNDVVDASLRNQLDSRIRFHLLGRKAGSHNPWMVLRLNHLIYSLRPDIIHSHNSSLWRFLWYPGLRSHRGLCVTQHSLFASGEVRDLNRFRHVFAISRSVQQSIMEGMGVASTVVYNGIHPERFTLRSGAAHKPFRILQISRLRHNEKGQDFLLDRVAALISRCFDLDLTFFGDGESRSFLEQKISDLGLSERVHMPGNKSQEYISQHLCDYDLLVQPSRFEGFGLTVAEAMAAGVPVLVSDIEGPMEIIENGRYGHSFRVDDAHDFDAKLEDILLHYDDALVTADKARTMVHDKYDVNRTAENYLNEYKTILAE